MIRVSIRRCLPLLLAGLFLLPGAWAWDNQHHRGRKYKPPPPTCAISVTVLRQWDSKPVEDAAVIFQPVNTENKPWGNMELKTNEEGRAKLNLIPIGSRLLLQVIAPGFKTYGKIYDIPGATKAITVRLQPPAQEYSIYRDHPDQKDSGQKQNDQKDQNNKDKQGSQPPQ